MAAAGPDAVSLPLGLAVALLKDSDGVIDIDLPVEGDVNDPEFKIGGVVMQAIVGLITKVVSAPFRMLGGLIGVESEDFGQFAKGAKAAMFWLGSGEAQPQLHNPDYDFPDAAIPAGAGIFLHAIRDLLG